MRLLKKLTTKENKEMEATTVKISEETINKMNKTLSNKEIGKLRLQKLVEASKNGKLQLAKRRWDVAQIAGYKDNQTAAGYYWVDRMIKRGVLTESLSDEKTSTGFVAYNYYLVESKLDAAYKPCGRKNTAKKTVFSDEIKTVDKMLQEISPVEDKKEENSMTIVIRRGDTEITLTNVTSEIAIETIKAVMN